MACRAPGEAVSGEPRTHLHPDSALRATQGFAAAAPDGGLVRRVPVVASALVSYLSPIGAGNAVRVGGPVRWSLSPHRDRSGYPIAPNQWDISWDPRTSLSGPSMRYSADAAGSSLPGRKCHGPAWTARRNPSLALRVAAPMTMGQPTMETGRGGMNETRGRPRTPDRGA